jgi:hypothetical protein
MVTPDPWMLTGPWYRWPKPGDAAAGRLSRPVFQKFESAGFVNDFLKDPQHSLKFRDPEDFVQEIRPRDPPLPPIDNKDQSLSANVSVKTDVRKLYLDTHKRFYLVVCELHCDAPGFPSVSRDQVCEAGFVVRRRIVDTSHAVNEAAAKAVSTLLLASARLAEIDALPEASKRGPLAQARQEAIDRYLEATKVVRVLAQQLNIRLALQGWVPQEFDRVGAWQEVEETPQQVVEQVAPLYPLVPDPRDKRHSARGRTIYFGVVPTAGADADPFGNARFEDRSFYEIRCFVRRHDPRCPKKSTRSDCRGELVWSQRTEMYRVAAPFDLTGTSNRPVTIVLPDIPALEAQTAAAPVGRNAPVKMVSPPGSPGFSVNTSTLKATPQGPSASICSFSIPLITIVATFVFRLFLPVVTFVLGLFFLLKLKFCIPPTVNLSAGVEAGLILAFGADIEGGLKAKYTTGVAAEIANGLAADFSAAAPAGMEVSAAPAGAVKADLPSITENLDWEPRVELEVS